MEIVKDPARRYCPYGYLTAKGFPACKYFKQHMVCFGGYKLSWIEYILYNACKAVQEYKDVER